MREQRLYQPYKIQGTTMDKIKEAVKNFFSAIGGYIILALGAVVGVLLYAFIRKSEQLQSAQAKLALANTQKEVDLIEVEIKQKMAQRDVTKRELADLQKSLDLIAEKRKNLKDTKTDSEIEDYWNKQ